MVTLEDIAEQLGISHSTVSRALAGSSLVNKETAARIRAVAQEKGYQVNQLARNLKTQSTKTIGLIVPEVSNPFFPRLIQGIAVQLKEKEYSLHLQLSGATQEDEEEALLALASNRVDGILLVTGERGLVASDRIASLKTSGIPIVLMGWVENAPAVDIVTGNDSAGGRAIAKHLADLGHTRIALIGKPPHRGEYDRVRGFLDELHEQGIPLHSEMTEYVENLDEVVAALNRLLDQALPPTAIFAYQDSIALQISRFLSSKGISIPDDISLVGFDDLELASVMSPGLTTVGGHIEPLTKEFVDLLFKRMKASDVFEPERVVITPQLIIRNSTSDPRIQKKHSLRDLP
jgi:LacI family transcriptional regulator